MATSAVRGFLVGHVMPEKCYEEFFVRWHFHAPCVTLLLNNTVGVWILLDVLLAQLLQLLKILWAGSAEGLSLISILLQLYASSCPVVFVMANNFPLFAWAERLFLLAQTAAVVFFILRYRGKTLAGMLFLLTYSGAMLLLGSHAPAAVISAMQSSSLAALIASKALQARTNYCSGHTGQLSTLSVLLSWAASLALIYVSLMDTESSVATMCHSLSAGLSCVLLAQVLCCGSGSGTTKKKSE